MATRLNWKNVFVDRMIQAGVSPEESQKIYQIEMGARSFFDFNGIVPGCFLLQNIEQDPERIYYYWESRSVEAKCPFCGTMSLKPSKDYYTKPVQDVPCSNKAVYHVVRFNKYQCENPGCDYGEFIERFSGFSEEDARKTIRFKKYCIERALGCACNHAEHELRKEGAIISNDTISRYLKSEVAKQIKSNISQDNVMVISVDDINLRKGDKSSGCTVLLDEETHKVLIILSGTTKEMTKRALEKFPSSQFFSRDRASSYSSAGEECKKEQVADRFHLIKNAHDAVKDALMASIPATIFVRDGDGWLQASPEETVRTKSYFYVPEEKVEERIRLAGLTPAKAKKYRNTVKLLELADKGQRTADIAKAMDIPYKDVQALRRSAVTTLQDVEDRIRKKVETQNSLRESCDERCRENRPKTVGGPNVRAANQSIVEPYRETVIDLVKKGGNHRTIYPVIQEQGYTGSSNAIYQYILKLHKESPDELNRELIEMPPELTLESCPMGKVYSVILKEAAADRPGHEKNDKHNTKPEAKRRPAETKNSPFSETVTELIFGHDAEMSQDETKPKKKPRLPKSNRDTSDYLDTHSIP